MTAETIHTCSYECERPACIRAQRDELASRLAAAPPPAAARWDVRGLPAGWTVEVDGEHVKVTKPDGAVSEWHKRPATNGSGMYDLCQSLAADGVQAGEVEQRARELLAAELRADMRPGAAEEAESGKLDHDSAMRAIVAALSQQQGQAVAQRLATPEHIGLYQGPDDCPHLQINGVSVAIFPAGSWSDVCSALDSITGSTAPPSAPVGVEAAKHWHDLYRKECQLRQDDAARYGQQIVELEALAQQPAAVDGAMVVVDAKKLAHLIREWELHDKTFGHDGRHPLIADFRALLPATQHQEPTT